MICFSNAAGARKKIGHWKQTHRKRCVMSSCSNHERCDRKVSRLQVGYVQIYGSRSSITCCLRTISVCYAGCGSRRTTSGTLYWETSSKYKCNRDDKELVHHIGPQVVLEGMVVGLRQSSPHRWRKTQP